MTLPVIPSIDDLNNRFATLLQQAMAEAQADGADLSASDVAIARSNLKAQAFVEAVGIHGAYRYIREFVAKQAIPTKSSDEYLNDWMDAYGIPRKEATAAKGKAAGTGTVGKALTAGTLLQRQDGTTYLVMVEAMVDGDGAVIASLTCTTTGTGGNLAEGEKLQLVESSDDIQSEFTVSAGGIAEGVDRELDVDAIYRLRQRLSNPPRGSAPSDYERWALSVPGITRAWGLRTPNGPTTAGVIIMADANEYGLPTEAQKTAVYNYIRDPERGPPDELFVIIPTAKFIDAVIAIDPDTVANRSAIELQLKDLFYREAVPGGRIPLSHVSEEISIAPGEFDHQLIQPEPVPGGFLFATAFEILVLRSVAFEAMNNG